MIDNPFIYGNPVSEPEQFFGRGKEIRLLVNRLRHREHGSSALVGERRIGKTSLLNYLLHPQNRQRLGLGPDKYLFVYKDLQETTSDTTPLQLWTLLLEEMSLSYKDEEISRAVENLQNSTAINTSRLGKIFDGLSKKGLHVVFFLDEFDYITRNENFTPEFFYNLRALAIQKRFSLVTSSCRDLIDLCYDDSVRASPFFNIFANIYLKPFTDAEARYIITNSLKGTDVTFTERDIATLLSMAGTHPYFLQVACTFLFQAHIFKKYGIDPALDVYAFIYKHFEDQVRGLLQVYWDKSSDQEKIVLTVLALLDRGEKIKGLTFNRRQLQDLYVHSSKTLKLLERRSLVVSKNEEYNLFSNFLSKWIYEEITDTKDDKQTYKEWLKSHQGVTDRLSTPIKREMGNVLPKIGNKYRELIISWISNPETWVAAAKLLKVAMGLT